MIDINHVLRQAEGGDVRAVKQLAELLYAELRELAQREMASERKDHTLQPTALVNEAYLRLAAGTGATFESKESFFAAAATAIRRVLVDHARSRARDKRGGNRLRVPLEGLDLAEPLLDQDLLDLDQALARLAEFDPTKARLVELRFFAGMTLPQLAKALCTSESTIAREWRLARAFLRTHMEGPK